MNRPAALTLLTLLLCAASPARAAESYDGCGAFVSALPAVLTAQGTYCMKQSLATAMTSGDAITIAGNNVTLDCNHFRLHGAGAGAATQAIGIKVDNRLNFTLRNCIVRGFRRGVRITGTASSGHVVVDNRFDGNRQVAIEINGSANTVRRNLILDTGAMTAEGEVWGIAANGDADIIDNTIDGVVPSGGGTQAGSYGIGLGGSSTSVIQGNRIRNIDGGNSSDYAIYATAGTFVSIEGNQLTRGQGGGNGNFGIYCGQDATVTDNRLHGYGIALVNCDDDGGNVAKP
jgi:hypothetical protein